MKKLKINFSVLALISGLTLAFATQSFKSETDLKYRLDESTGVWSPESGTKGDQYGCELSSDICTARFPVGVNPNDQENDSYPGIAQPSDVEDGIYFEM